jgi:magnesium chelatase family protein
MRVDVARAREAQAARFKGGATRYNAQMTSREVRKHCMLGAACTKLLRHSVEELGLSARAHDKVLRVARTIADVEGAASIGEAHLAEAINYRSLDADLWT